MLRFDKAINLSSDLNLRFGNDQIRVCDDQMFYYF